MLNKQVDVVQNWVKSRSMTSHCLALMETNKYHNLLRPRHPLLLRIGSFSLKQTDILCSNCSAAAHAPGGWLQANACWLADWITWPQLAHYICFALQYGEGTNLTSALLANFAKTGHMIPALCQICFCGWLTSQIFRRSFDNKQVAVRLIFTIFFGCLWMAVTGVWPCDRRNAIGDI